MAPKVPKGSLKNTVTEAGAGRLPAIPMKIKAKDVASETHPGKSRRRSVRKDSLGAAKNMMMSDATAMKITVLNHF